MLIPLARYSRPCGEMDIAFDFYFSPENMPSKDSGFAPPIPDRVPAGLRIFLAGSDQLQAIFTPSTASPSIVPTFTPSKQPTFTPSTQPTFTPSTQPTVIFSHLVFDEFVIIALSVKNTKDLDCYVLSIEKISSRPAYTPVGEHSKSMRCFYNF